jgi:hypothetical protein
MPLTTFWQRYWQFMIIFANLFFAIGQFCHFCENIYKIVTLAPDNGGSDQKLGGNPEVTRDHRLQPQRLQEHRAQHEACRLADAVSDLFLQNILP